MLELVQNLRKDKKQKVIVTGHSLGGALATLAAYDLELHASVPAHKLECYTFGAPRVGNYPFAYDYDQRVPNTWNVINDQVSASCCIVVKCCCRITLQGR